MAVNAKTGRELLHILAPVLGVEDLSGIRSITVHADHDDVAWMEIDRIVGREGITRFLPLSKSGSRERCQITVERVR